MRGKSGDANRDTLVKTVTDSNQDICVSIKSLAIKRNTNVKVTSKFMNGKMLTFSKMSAGDFIYDVIDVFTFPYDATRDIHLQNKIINCLPYLLLTDTDSPILIAHPFNLFSPLSKNAQ